MSSLEKQKLVWTDLRPSNLVTVKGKVKAIDLESAVELGSKPVDCTPEVTPPEIAQLYVSGKLTQARVQQAYDVWSFGMLVLFLATGGKQLFDASPSNSGRVMLGTATLTPETIKAEINRLLPGDAKTAAFLQRVLVVDPAKRPALGSLRRDLYLASPF